MVNENVKKILNHIDNEIELVNRNILSQSKAFLIAILAFIAALAWDEAIKEIFESYFEGSDLASKVLYAVLVTAIAIIFVIVLNRGAKKRLHFPHPHAH